MKDRTLNLKFQKKINYSIDIPISEEKKILNLLEQNIKIR